MPRPRSPVRNIGPRAKYRTDCTLRSFESSKMSEFSYCTGVPVLPAPRKNEAQLVRKKDHMLHAGVAKGREKGNKPPPSPLMKEGVSRIKNGMALERSFSSSGQANDGALAAGEYRIAKELMDTLSTDVGTPRSVRQALEQKSLEVQRRLDSLEVKLPSESRAQAQALAAAARVERQQAAEAAASAVKVQAVVRGRQARAAAADVRAERRRQHAAATCIQARRRANLARAEMRSMPAADVRVGMELHHAGPELLTGMDKLELDDGIMELLMSPSIMNELAGPPPPPPPPQPYAARLAQLQRHHQELEAEPSVLPIDARLVTASVTACAQSVRSLLQRAMHAVTCNATLQVEEIALEYIARCFVAGGLLPLEPETEPTPVVGQDGGDHWTADRTLSAFLGGLEAKVANAMSTGLLEHLQAEEPQQPKDSEQWERRLAERIGSQLLVLSSNPFGGEAPPVLSAGLSVSGQAPEAETATPAAVAEAAAIQAEAARVAQLRDELGGLRLSALRKRASVFGADEQMIDEAEDNDDPKEALVSLIVLLASRDE